MTLDIALMLTLLGVAVALFALEWISVDVVTLLLLVSLILLHILTPQEAFTGFANEIIVILGSIFVLSGALTKTGVMDWLGAVIHKMGSGSRVMTLLYLTAFAAGVSAFINNTTATALFLPAVLALCKESKMSPSQTLIPLAYASMLGGTCTLIGTSTNIAASTYLQMIGMEPFGLFEFASVGLVMVVTGILYMSLVGSRLLPATPQVGYTEVYKIKDFLSEIMLPVGSPLAGSMLQQTPLADLGFMVLRLIRNEQTFYPQPYTTLLEGDTLIVKGTRESLLQIKDLSGIEIRPDVTLGDQDLVGETLTIAEAIVMPQSVLVGRTIKEINFRQRYGVTVIAIYRKGHALASKLGEMRLLVGDVLLLQGRTEQFALLGGESDIWVLDERGHIPFRQRRGIYAVAILVLAVGIAGFKVVPLSAAFLLAALSSILLGCLTLEEAYDFIDWRLIILIGGMTSFGVAMEKTQTANYVADLIVAWTSPFGVYSMMSAFVLATMLLTQPMSNAAAVLVILPVALNAATQLAINPRTFAVLITLAGSLSFVTPFEPSCLLVYGPGKYRFRDFVVSGLPLTLLAAVILLVLVPLLWPLR